MKEASGPSCSDGTWFYDGNYIYYKNLKADDVIFASNVGTESPNRRSGLRIFGNNWEVKDLAFERSIYGVVHRRPNANSPMHHRSVINCDFTAVKFPITFLHRSGTSAFNGNEMIATGNVIHKYLKGITVTCFDKLNKVSKVQIKNNTLTHLNTDYVWAKPNLPNSVERHDFEGIGLQNVTESDISGNTINHIVGGGGAAGWGLGVAMWYKEGAEAHDLKINDNIVRYAHNGFQLLSGNDTDIENVEIRNNTARSCALWGIRVNGDGGGKTVMRGNKVRDCGTNYLYNRRDSANSKFNVSWVKASSSDLHVHIKTTAGSGSPDLNRNIYYGTGDRYSWFGNMKNFDEWQDITDKLSSENPADS